MANYLTDVLSRSSLGVNASAVIPFTAAPAAGDLITINGHTFIFGTDWRGFDASSSASSLATFINRNLAPASESPTPASVYPYFAFAVGPNLYLISRQSGVIGNSLAIAGTTANSAFTVPATFTGGVDPEAGKNVEIGAGTPPVVTSGSAYTAGNVLGGILAFVAPPANNGGGLLDSIKIALKSVQTTGLKLTLFSANPSASTFTDKTAPTINAADVNKIIGTFSLTSDSTLGTYTAYFLNAIQKVLGLPVGQTIYGVITVVATPTFTSTTDLADVRIGIQND